MSDTENRAIDPLIAEYTAEVVSAYVSNNAIPAADLPSLIAQVHGALARTANTTLADADRAVAGGPDEKQEPAVAIKSSVGQDRIACLECGRSYKTLKRHLASHHDLSPEAYREKWNLSQDYPLVAPNYAATRSRLAKEIGLGESQRQDAG